MEKNKIWVVVLAYNEAKYLGSFLTKLGKVTKNIIVVNDHSTDKTAQITKQYTKHALDNEYSKGKGGAMRYGADYAFDKLGAEAVIFMDGDGQHNPKDLSIFYETLVSHKFDVIFGVRHFGYEMPLIRMIGNRICSFMVYLLFGKFIYDIPSGFKTLTKKAYQKVRWSYSGYTVELEIAVRTIKAGLKYTFVDIATIYHDMDRGMKLDNLWWMGLRLLKWKIKGFGQ